MRIGALMVLAGLLVLAFAGCVDTAAAAQRRDGGAKADAGGAKAAEATGNVLPPPPPPVLPPSPTRACKKDSDCAFVDRPCTCAPCGEFWREVINQKELARLKAQWSRRRCEPVACPMCVGTPLGTKAVCAAGQCAPR